MNERIKQLAEQAGAIEAKDITNIPRALSLNGEEIEMFAQLIVTECMNTLQDFKYKSDKFDPSDLFQATHNAVLDTMIDAFKEDFGVENAMD